MQLECVNVYVMLVMFRYTVDIYDNLWHRLNIWDVYSIEKFMTWNDDDFGRL